jgi:hypothetical protein
MKKEEKKKIQKEVKEEVKEKLEDIKEDIKDDFKEEKLTKKDIKAKAEAGMTLDEIKRENKRIKRRSSANRFFATLFLLILFYIFGVVSGVYVADKYNVTLFVKEKTPSKKVDPVKEECTIINCEKITYSGVYSGNVYEKEDGTGSILSVSLELDDNGYASLVSTLNGEVVEISSGTYDVKDNKLTYNRVYAKGGYDQNNNIYLVKIVASSNGSYKYSNLFDNSRNKEVFTITENGFTLNSYAKAIISVDKFIELNK